MNPSRCCRALRVAALAAVLAGCSTAEQSQPQAPPPPKPVAMQKVKFDPVRPGGLDFTATLNGKKLRLMEADDAKNPTAWQGPLRVQDTVTNATCDADVSLITSVYGSAGADGLIVVTYSGSLTYVHFVSLASCKNYSPTIKAYTGSVDVAGNRLTIQPACECGDKKKPCTCSAAQIHDLDASGRPALNEKDSLELTQRTLGIAFFGTKQVLEPKTPRAKIVEP